VFTTLPESGRLRTRRAGGTSASFIAHYGLVLALVYASSEASPPLDAPRPETIRFQRPPAPAEPAPLPEAVVAPPPPRTVSALVPPLTIPSVLPAIDLERVGRLWEEFTPGPGILATAGRAAEPRPSADPDAVYTAPQVEQPAIVVSSATPGYPDALRRAGVEGEVVVSFVVDTLGRADMTTYTVIRATHDLFARAVRDAVSRERFRPAEVGAMKVRQLVQQPFAFSIVAR